MTPEELHVRVPWGEIRGLVWGPEDGHPVLCLHGLADNCGSFSTLIPLLPPDFRYVAMDFPGHGRSSHRPPGTFYNLTAYVADVRRVVQALRWSHFTLMGHSMGGNVAGTFSALYPEMVENLVLLESFGFLPSEAAQVPARLRQVLDGMLQLESTEKKPKVYSYEGAAERLSVANPSLTPESVRVLLRRGLVDVDRGFQFSRDFALSLGNVRISVEHMLQLQMKIRAAVLIVTADEGFKKQYPDSERDQVAARLLQVYRAQQATLVSVPGDHHCHLNRPEGVAAVLSPFLLQKTGRSSAKL
ncbi:serine hydrolase-like protein [Synchiropus splendidus]|uniref:serine hydrolase-like protein n=1 Tax=Synchiropus splendidus TaxID=270530 RepID=UPI00237E96E8|nr:serine hydrolase-like protein [Synchiropus splendidus]